LCEEFAHRAWLRVLNAFARRLNPILADIRAAGALSILDVKRGDIGSTMDAYAAAYLTDGSPLAADAVTLSPYLGFGSLGGAVELARALDGAVRVLRLQLRLEARDGLCGQ